jgi:tetratricopeptide (TPR) repeat protein
VTDPNDKDSQPAADNDPGPGPVPDAGPIADSGPVPGSGPIPGPSPGPDSVETQDTDTVVSSRPRGASLRWLIIALLCLMLLTLLGVVVVLPDLVADRVVNEQKPVPASPPVIAPAPPPSADAQRLAREKREAQRRLGIALAKQTELEAEGVAIWGGQDYDVALNALAAGDAELQVGRYAKAADIYEKLGERLDGLRASMADRLESALQAGEVALAANDGPAARFSFKMALAIEPHNVRGQRGMLRAQVVEDVLALLAAGAEHEARAELDIARDKYAAALSLDASSSEASLAHVAVTAKIDERDFNAAMSIALEALERGDLAASRAALARAEDINPGTPAVADVGTRLTRAVQARRIDEYRNQAEALARDERWGEAGGHYAAVLAIDSTAAFARSGEEKSRARARIHAELDVFLAQLGRLSAKGPRDTARQLLATMAELNAASEPKLAAKSARLGKALEIAETPVAVRLQSDNFTDVTVYKVGRFGRFASRDIVLLPGRYVAVGTRSGYRDVRVEFAVAAGQKDAEVTVRCKEKI